MFTTREVKLSKALIEIRQYLDGILFEHPDAEGDVKDINAGLIEIMEEFDEIKEEYRQYGYDDGYTDAKNVYEGEYEIGYEEGRLEGYREGYEIGFSVAEESSK